MKLSVALVVAGLAVSPSPVRAAAAPPAGVPKVAHLRTEYRQDPLGIDAPKPRLSWQLQASRRGVTPAARLADVTESGRALATGNGITGQKQDGDVVVVEVGSGSYRFAYPTKG